MAIREYQCRDCGHVWDEVIRYKEDIPEACVQCDSLKIDSLLTAPGGYHINGSNSASVRPKGAGSFKKGK
jgi:putative FmdB family regulatory protein